MKKLILLSVLLSALLLASCNDNSDDLDAMQVFSGDLDVTTYVALGNSLTAGFQSGGWTWEMHQESFATNIAIQLYGAENVGSDENEHRFLMARFTEGGNPRPATITRQEQVGEYADGTPVYRFQLSPTGFIVNNFFPANNTALPNFNNLAVPGFMGIDIATTVSSSNILGNVNPLYQITLRNAGQRGSALAQARAKEATLVSIWAGNNEVLGAALSGAQNPTYPLQNTDGIPGFSNVVDQLVDPLVSDGAKVVLMNVPFVTSIPAVTGIGVESSTGNRAFIADLNADGAWTDTLTFYGTDPADGATRTVLASEYVLLSWLSNVNFTEEEVLGLHPSNPLPPNLWLTETEIETLSSVVAGYNQILAQKASSNPNVALMDFNTFFGGVVANGGVPELGLTLDLFTGGIFSLDGVHPSAISHRIVANEVIKVMNAEFGAEIPLVQITAPSALMGLGGGVDLMNAKESGLLQAYENAARLFVGEME